MAASCKMQYHFKKRKGTNKMALLGAGFQHVMPGTLSPVVKLLLDVLML